MHKDIAGACICLYIRTPDNSYPIDPTQAKNWRVALPSVCVVQQGCFALCDRDQRVAVGVCSTLSHVFPFFPSISSPPIFAALSFLNWICFHPAHQTLCRGDGGDDGPMGWPLDDKVQIAPVVPCKHQHIFEEDACDADDVVSGTMANALSEDISVPIRGFWDTGAHRDASIAMSAARVACGSRRLWSPRLRAVCLSLLP